MRQKISCKQVQAILSFYIKGRVSPALNEIIEEHLNSCPKCKNLYLKMFENSDNTDYVKADNDTDFWDEIDKEKYSTREYENFKQKLSAYFDSELEDNETIKIKKMTISNPLARKDLENM